MVACQLASREGATGASREQIIAAATTAARKVAEGPFGQFANLKANDGADFTTGLKIKFLQVTPGDDAAVDSGGKVDSEKLVYELCVESSYQITIPLIGTSGHCASENLIDHPEGLAQIREQ